MTTPFVDKVENSLTEISTDNEFKDESSISSNWRGYENKNAKEQWREANILEEIFGEGIGTKIKLKALPETHKKMYGLTDSSTPLLHNGYYTLLIKGGLLSIVGLLIWLLYPLMIFRPKIKSNYLIDVYAEMLIVNIMMLIVMYVIRGLVGSGTFTVWAVIIGWNSCRLKQLSL
jgi:branched-subunit amino acid transport protein AzlD